jgi:peptidoglycan/xylan/chitin deacetylase (PgdA/CDA1 family)
MIWVSYDTRFEEQMQFLRDAGYTTLDMDDYHEIRKGLRPLPDRPVAITFDDGYLSTYTLGYPVLKRLGLKATVFVLLEPDEHSRNLVKGIDDYLTPQQMQEMAANGISIQSHTVSHCILNELGDDDAWRELTESRQRISEITGRPVRHIAIPRSGYSRRIKKLAAKAGYLTACCNNKGSANGWSNLLALPRIVVERDMTLDDFEQCLSPNGGILLRTAGNLKRLPERLGGARFAYWLRGILYRDPWGRLFATKNLKKIVLGVAAAYLLCSAWFCWHLVAN